MEILFSTILASLLVIYGFKAYRLYPTYKNSIFQTLIPSFLEYFYRYVIRKDVSTSSYLKNQLGPHRMSFTTLQNNDHKVTSRFIILLYNKGIALISFFDPNGTLSGKEADKHWLIQRTNKIVKISNPMIESNKYIHLIQKKYPNFEITQYVAVSDSTDISKVKTDFTVCHYCDILKVLQEANTHYVDEKTIIDAFNKASN